MQSKPRRDGREGHKGPMESQHRPFAIIRSDRQVAIFKMRVKEGKQLN